ncbi:MAG TPA: methyltransferase domain-containing protein [Anaerolineae bacterium]|nr:methyltransferase domain-containing protein [Anaerolineae bacterium]
MTVQPQTVFAQRAAFYTTSAVHKDKVVLDRLVELACVRSTDRVLDVATGTGHTAFAFAPHVREVIATDLTPEMLSEAEKLKSELGLHNVDFRIADAHALPFDDKSFDVVTCRRAAHHFTEIRRALREMRRVLRPGGRLVIDDRSVPEDDFADATLNRLDWLHDHSHVRQYRPSEWQSILHEAGFVVETVEPYTRHRPLSAFTNGVEPESIAEIERIVAGWDETQRAVLNVAEKDGEIYLNHWYVMVVGVKNEE